LVRGEVAFFFEWALPFLFQLEIVSLYLREGKIIPFIYNTKCGNKWAKITNRVFCPYSRQRSCFYSPFYNIGLFVALEILVFTSS
jgi:hypothetical protein